MVQLQKVQGNKRLAYSKLQQERLASKCIKPSLVLADAVRIVDKEALGAKDHHEQIQALFPNTYGKPRVEFVAGGPEDKVTTPLHLGVVLSGGQAPGGHNVIAGIFDYAKKCSPDSKVVGFMNGPHGVMNGIYTEITPEMMDGFRNTGGFDMLGSGRHKIETPAQMEASREVCEQLGLDGLIVIGGDDSNTNAAILGEYFQAKGSTVKVAGCPKTIDGDLKNEYIPISFGFDTACKTFSEEIGNVALDALASQKYYHFIRVMGRAASNIALECALQTRPNVCLISEEVEAKGMSLIQITTDLVNMIVKRSQQGKNYGVVMLPEGLIEFIPEFNHLIAEINDVLATGVNPTEEEVAPLLNEDNRAIFHYLPKGIQLQLLLDRDPHGNVQVAKIETEVLLASTVAVELDRLRGSGLYKGKFAPQFHSFGYEGRCALPSLFDCSYCYTLGYTAGCLIGNGRNGLMASATGLDGHIEDWVIGGVPITMMCHMERRKGKDKPVIKKALVELEGAPFKAFVSQRDKWMLHDLYRAPGPIQFYAYGCRNTNMTLLYELLGDEANHRTELDIHEDHAPAPKPMGRSKILFRPTPPGLRSDLERSRLSYQPRLPPALSSGGAGTCRVVMDEATQASRWLDRAPLARMFPNTYGASLLRFGDPDEAPQGMQNGNSSPTGPITVGVVFCGRQAAGGHNIIWGIHDFLKGTGSKVLGFVGGTRGLFDDQHVEITDELLSGYKNQGGFDLLGRTVDSIKTESEVQSALSTCQKHKLDGLVLIGSNRTNTDAAYLAEFFKAEGVKTAVVGVPCSISGAMKNQFVDSAVGFDTAVKVYSQLVGNTAIDGASARKYWYFMRVMGQDPSHIALEVAQQTAPNVVLLAEEVATKHWSLGDIVREIADAVQARCQQNKDFGTVLVPEGLITAIPEMSAMIEEIDAIYAEATTGERKRAISSPAVRLSVPEIQARLTKWSAALLASLPAFIQSQVCLERQSDHKVQLSQIETEKLLVHFVEEELTRRKAAGQYSGTFSAVCSYLGYQARSAIPSNFDCDYAYTLGATSAVLVQRQRSGYLATVTGLKGPVEEWEVGGVPLTAMLVADDAEKTQSGQKRPRIPPQPIDVHGQAFKNLKESQQACQLEDMYNNPGPVQYAGSTENDRLKTLMLDTQDYLGEIKDLRQGLARISEACRPGCSSTLVKIATKTLQNLTDIIALSDQQNW